MENTNIPNTKPVIEIRKSEDGSYWLEYVDMTDHEALGILHMMVIRVENAIRKEDLEKHETG